jgi:hypothetical protein
MFRKNFMPQHGHRFGTPETDRSRERTREQKYTVDQLNIGKKQWHIVPRR